MTFDPFPIPEAEEALDAFAVQLAAQKQELAEIVRVLTLDIAHGLSETDQALVKLIGRLNRILGQQLAANERRLEPVIDALNTAMAGTLEEQSVRIAGVSGEAVSSSAATATAEEASPPASFFPPAPPTTTRLLTEPTLPEGGTAPSPTAPEMPPSGTRLLASEAPPPAGSWSVIRSPDGSICLAVRSEQAGFYPTYTVLGVFPTQAEAEAQRIALCFGAPPPVVPPPVVPPPVVPPPVVPPPVVPPPITPPPDPGPVIPVPPDTPTIPPRPLPGCPQLPGGAIGSEEFCSEIESWKAYFRQVGQVIFDLLGTGGEFTNVQPVTVADWILQAIGLNATTVTGVVNVLASSQLGVDFGGLLRRWYDAVTCAVRCDPPLYLGLAFARTLLDLVDSFRIGLNLGAIAQLEVKVRLDQATRVVDYLQNHACPTEIASPAEIHELYLRGEITESHARCLLEMHGLQWEQQRQVISVKRSRPNPLEVIQLYMRGEIDREEFDERMRQHGYLDTRDAVLEARLQQQIPPLSDLPRFMTRDVEDPNVVSRYQLDAESEQKFQGRLRYWAAAQGIPEEYMRYVWRAHWVYPSNTQLFEMLHRLRPGRVPEGEAVTEEMVAEVLGINDLAPIWRRRVMATSYNPLTRVDTQRAYFIGALSEEDLYNSYRDLGYNDENARRLVEFTKRLKLLRVSSHHWSKIYIDGGIDRAEAERRLAREGFTEEEIQFGLNLAEMRRTAALRKKWNLHAANQMVNGLFKAYKAGTIDRQDLIGQLVGIGWGPDAAEVKANALDIEARTALANQTVSRIGRSVERGDVSLAEAAGMLETLGVRNQRRQELLASWQLRLTSSARGATASQVVRWYKLGLIDEATARVRLANLGYPDAEASLLVAEAGLALARQEATARQSEDRQSRTQAAEMERLVRAGEQQLERFRAALRRLSPMSKLQKWLKLGIIGDDFFFSRAEAMGYPPEEAARYHAEARHGSGSDGGGDEEESEA